MPAAPSSHQPLPAASPEPVTSSIIAASAGTGKTYQLTLRFIALLALGVPPAQMIALTFTRKAAGEFCDRILSELAKGAASREGAQTLAARVRQTWHGGSDSIPLCPSAQETRHPLTQQHFHRMLQALSEALGHIKLTTLDSYFFSLLSANLYDLGVGALTLLDDAGKQQAQRQAQDSLFASISGNDTQLEHFLANFSSLSDNHRGNIRETFDDIIATYSEHFLSAPDRATWSNPGAFHLPDLLATPSLPADYYDNAAREMEHLSPRSNASAQLLKGLLAFPGKMKARNLKGISTVLKHISEPPANATPALQSMLRLANDLYETTRHDILRESEQRTLAIHQLLHQYQQHYQALIRNSGKLDFSDITRAIPRLLEKQGAPTRIAYRLDSTLRHWMLDEFQDTSQEQWKAILPLISEIITEIGNTPHGATNRSLFIVGDTKQSIYGWRGASANLFEQLQHIPGLQHMNMVTSWRSAPAVLDFVNHVFRYHGTELEHRSAHPQLSGYVQVSSFDPTGESGKDLYESIADILSTLPIGKKQISIGILTRTNDQAAAIASWLKQNTAYHISSLSDIPIGTDSPLGATLLSFLKWLAHPSDPYHYAVWHNSPLQPIIESEENPWQSWNRKLETNGYAAVLRQLQTGMKHAGIHLTTYHQSRLQHWLRAAAAIDRSGGSLTEWIETMQQLTLKENPPKHIIQVLTVHKSKGLEYDAVILPFQSTQEPQNTRHLNILRASSNGERATGSTIRGILIPPSSQEKRDLWPELAPFVSDWQQQQINENRNLLYVALTRAARANYILLTNKAKSDKTYHAGIILNTLEHIAQQNSHQSPAETGKTPPSISEKATAELLRIGDPQWHKHLPEPPPNTPPEPPLELPVPPQRRQRKSPSQLETDYSPAQEPPPGTTPAAPAINRAHAQQLGTEVHALLEQILWWEPETVPAWFQNPQSEAEHIASASLKAPEIQPYFTSEPGAEAYNEQRLEAVTDSTWTSAVIDRLILYPQEQRAQILDYKTNRDTTGLKEHYRPQMQTYRALVAQATGYPLNRISAALIHLSTQPTLLCYEESDWAAPTEQNPE